MVDKIYCMSSYLAFRYIAEREKDFYEGMKHELIKPVPDEERILVNTADEIDEEIKKQMGQFKYRKKGILLSGGMDSAIVASYLSRCDAYTFRFLDGEYQRDELKRAEYYAKYYDLNLHYVDISWNTVTSYLDSIMELKAAPVHSIEPQIVQAALQAKNDGIEIMFIGESSDLIFGGMDGLLAKDWKFDEFVDRYMFMKPEDVLVDAQDMSYLFERYRKGEKIDFLRFMDDVFSIESSSSYMNAFSVAQMPYYDPYAKLKMASPLYLQRVRNGESKYLIRELMKKKYPEIPVPNKIPMPRPVDIYFADWNGPKRKEFKKNLDMRKFTGNQKWQIYCLERFLNKYEES